MRVRVLVRDALKFLFLFVFLFLFLFLMFFVLRLPFERFVSVFALSHFVAWLITVQCTDGQFVCGLYAIFHLNPASCELRAATGRHAFHLCRFIGGSRSVKRVFSACLSCFCRQRSGVPVGGSEHKKQQQKYVYKKKKQIDKNNAT